MKTKKRCLWKVELNTFSWALEVLDVFISFIAIQCRSCLFQSNFTVMLDHPELSQSDSSLSGFKSVNCQFCEAGSSFGSVVTLA